MNDAAPVCRFLYEVGYLKRSPRVGWEVGGVAGRIESVAEHSFRTAILAHLIATAEGGNADRAATLGLYHDVPETRIGDIPYVGRRYLTAAEPETIVKDQTSSMPEAISGPVRAAVAEFEAGETVEAVCARDADKLECLLQAREYQVAGATDIDAWIESSQRAVKTETGRRLAEEALVTHPGDWWRAAQGLR